MAAAARKAAGAKTAQGEARRGRRPGAHPRGARGRAERRTDRRRQRSLAPDKLAANLAACAEAGVTLVEQPLPAGDDAALARSRGRSPVCADESVHDRASLPALVGKYDAVNIKLDKTGGLTEALAMAREAERSASRLMVGCMVATSLSMAPAMLVAQRARVVDLDGPLLLARDRSTGCATRTAWSIRRPRARGAAPAQERGEQRESGAGAASAAIAA